jgi:hypothetical protein
MGLKDVLQKHNIPLPSDYDEREELLIAALRHSPSYSKKMATFKAKTKRGGADVETPDTEDWLGPKLNTFIDVVTSPAARGALQGIFAVVFFLKYLESIPVMGNILSAVLDLMVMDGKMMIKTVQTALPPVIGLLPLPYASMFGLALAALFGMFTWPVVGVVSLSRADFTAAVESFIRVIPPPIGDQIANIFLEGNRAVARIDAKREKLVEDLTTAFTTLSEAASGVSSGVEEGFNSLKTSLKDTVAQTPVPSRTGTLRAGNRRRTKRLLRKRRIHK